MQVSGQSTGPTQSDPELTIAPMSVADVSAVHAILKESPEASMWSEESLLESASYGGRVGRENEWNVLREY